MAQPSEPARFPGGADGFREFIDHNNRNHRMGKDLMLGQYTSPMRDHGLDFYNYGVGKMKEEHFELAVVIFVEALRQNPTNMDAAVNLGVAHLRLNDKDGACQAWQHAEKYGDPYVGKLIEIHCKEALAPDDNWTCDTLHTEQHTYSDLEVTDFNEDGNQDVLVYYFTNVPGYCDLPMFDPVVKKLRIVEDFVHFPASLKLSGTDLYFSYHRSGCADSNWGSELFYIKNFKAVQVGMLDYYGCEDSEQPGLHVFRTKDGQDTFMSYTPYEVGYRQDKMELIKQFWSENHQMFTSE